MIKGALILQTSTELAETVEQRSLSGVVLLGGSVRPTRFHTSVERSLLDLPYASARTLLDEWCDQIAGLAAHPGRRMGGIPLRILSDQLGENSDNASSKDLPRRITVTFDRDPSEWRGTGGVLRDISTHYAPDDLLLVANAAQFLLRPLVALVAELKALGADVAVLSHRDGTPTTLMLVRCGCLKGLPEVGFVDMKEQGIPLLAATHDVRAVCVEQGVTLGLRTTKSYLAGLRALHLRDKTNQDDNWRSAFALTEEGTQVDSTARLHDSVVLRGGRVGSGAVLVRSVVCAGGIVPARSTIVDKLVTKEGLFDAGEGRT